MNHLTKPKAWHKDSKLMFDVVAINYVDKTVVINWDGRGDYKSIKLEQFEFRAPTGFLDAAGKIKYVGDITVNQYSTHVVVFNERTGAFMSKSLGGVFYSLNNESVADMRIVGNIYEQPELLRR